MMMILYNIKMIMILLYIDDDDIKIDDDDIV